MTSINLFVAFYPEFCNSKESETMEFIDGLIGQVNLAITRAKEYKELELSQLTWRERPDSWNVLECLEHLNRYGDFYLPEIEKTIKGSKSGPVSEFKSGWLGGILAKSMEPREKVNKVKTFKSKNPLNTTLELSVIETFLNQQHKTLDLLEAARKVNLNTEKVQTSISRFIRLRLGDTFQFMINHVMRHLKQADNVLVNSQKEVRN